MCWTGFECLTLILPPFTSTSLLALSANIWVFSCCRELWLWKKRKLWVSLRRGEVRVSTGQTQAYSLTLCTLKASDKSHKAPLAPLTWLPTIYESSGFQCGAKLTTFFFFFLKGSWPTRELLFKSHHERVLVMWLIILIPARVCHSQSCAGSTVILLQ